MRKYFIYRKCPFCEQDQFSVEQYGKNMWFLACVNPNVSAGFWVEQTKWGTFRRISVNKHPEPKERMSIRAKSQFDKLQIPYWRLMGHKAKPHEIAYEKELKRRGMTYGDAVLQRNSKGTNSSAIGKLQKFMQNQ